MTRIRKDLPQIPPRLASRPIDHRGYPVPWFVSLKDDEGRWDFRAVHPSKISQAYNKQLCWICGQPRGRYQAFVIGPMCAVNRTTGEPPCHRDCAIFTVKACPFLVLPNAQRRDANLPEKLEVGHMIKRNPGVAVVWITRTYSPFPVENGILFRLGPPTETLWFAEGREATQDEVQKSVSGGLPALVDMAQNQGEYAVAELGRQLTVAQQLFGWEEVTPAGMSQGAAE